LLISKGSSVKKNIKMLLYGEKGTWKSSIALQTLALKTSEGRDMRVAYIDTEFGSVDNYIEDFCEEHGVNPDNILIVKTNTYEETAKAIETIIKNEPFYMEDEEGNEVEVLDAEGKTFIADAIVLDSMTVINDTVQYGMIKVSEKRAKLKAKAKENANSLSVFVAEQTAGMELKDYNKLKHKGKNLIRTLISRTNKVVVVTAREKDIKKNKLINGKSEMVTVGVEPDCFKGIEYEVYTVLHLYEDKDTGEIYGKVEGKDRTGQFPRNHILKNPSLFAWQEVINSNKGKKDIKMEQKSYDEVIDEQANNLVKKSSTKNTEVDSKVEQTLQKEEDKKTEYLKDLTSNDVYNEIGKYAKSMTQKQKSDFKTALSKNDLPMINKSLSKEKLYDILMFIQQWSEENGIKVKK